MGGETGYRHPGVAGSGTIGCGIAAIASVLGQVHLLARSDTSAWRAEESAQAMAAKIESGQPDKIKVTTDAERRSPGATSSSRRSSSSSTTKGALLAELAEVCPDADLASTTSSLSSSR